MKAYFKEDGSTMKYITSAEYAKSRVLDKKTKVDCRPIFYRYETNVEDYLTFMTKFSPVPVTKEHYINSLK